MEYHVELFSYTEIVSILVLKEASTGAVLEQKPSPATIQTDTGGVVGCQCLSVLHLLIGDGPPYWSVQYDVEYLLQLGEGTDMLRDHFQEY